MDKCPSINILSQTISTSFRHIFWHINNLITSLCVYVLNEHLVVLSQMSDPNPSYLDKMPKWLENVLMLTIISNTVQCITNCLLLQFWALA